MPAPNSQDVLIGRLKGIASQLLDVLDQPIHGRPQVVDDHATGARDLRRHRHRPSPHQQQRLGWQELVQRWQRGRLYATRLYIPHSHFLVVNRLAKRLPGRFHHGLGQRRMGVRGQQQLFIGGFEPESQRQFGDQLRGLGP